MYANKGSTREKYMNVAIFTDTYFPDINGVTSSVYTLSEELKKRGHNVYVFPFQSRGRNSKKRKSMHPCFDFQVSLSYLLSLSVPPIHFPSGSSGLSRSSKLISFTRK